MSTNPYEAATIEPSPDRVRRSLWRMFPALFFLFLGLGLVALVVTAFIMIARDVTKGRIPTPGINAYLGAGAWTVSGILCIAAAVFFWRAKYRKGVYTAVAAFAVISIQSAIDSWFF